MRLSPLLHLIFVCIFLFQIHESFGLNDFQKRDELAFMQQVDSCSRYHLAKGEDSTFINMLQSLNEQLNQFIIKHECSEDYLKARTFYANAISYSKPNRSVKLYYAIIREAHQHGFVLQEAHASHSLATIFFNNGLYSESIAMYIESSDLFRTAKDWGAYGYSLIDIGNVYIKFEAYDKALQHYQKAEQVFNRYFEAKDKSYDLAVCYNNYAEVAKANKEFTKALDYYKIALKYRKNGNLIAQIPHSYYYISSVYDSLGKLDSALFFAEGAIEINEENGFTNDLSFSYFFYGKVLQKVDTASAIRYLYKAYHLSREIQSVRRIMASTSALARLYSSISIDSSLILYNELYQMSVKYNDQYYLMSSVNRLISIYEELDDSENLIVFLKLKNELLEEFNNKKMYRSEYLIEEQSWSKEKEVLESLAKRRQLLFALIGIIATLMTMLVITMLVNRRKLKINSNELKRVNSELQSTIRSRDVIYAVIAHDLRGPIGTSASLLDMITQQDGDEEDNKFLLEKIKVSMASSYILLENLLSWANLKMGDLRFHPDYYNISSIVEDQSQIFAEQASSKQIVLNNKVSKDMQAYFDFNTISTVVRNLISNALKFSVSGSEITFYAKIVDQNLHFCVQDRGIGMNDLTLSQLFDSAELRSTKGTNNESGSGLGLKLCKEFVLMNKGQIWAESTVDQGSTFYFSIPLQNTSEIV